MSLFYIVFCLAIFSMAELLIYNEAQLITGKLVALRDLLLDLRQDLTCAGCTMLCFNADEKKQNYRKINDSWKENYDKFVKLNKKYNILKFFLCFVYVGFKMPKYDLNINY